MSNQKTIGASKTFYFEFLRMVAAFTVVVIHIGAGVYEESTLGSLDYYGYLAIESIIRWSVPVFVMISGSLMLKPERELSLKKLYGKYVIKLFVALVVWSFIYALVYDGSVSKKIDLFIEGKGHLWYLQMIVPLYMLLPIIRQIAKNKKATEYFIILFLIFKGFIFTAQEFLMEFGRKEVIHPEYFNVICGYAGYMLLGYWIAENEISKKFRTAIYCLGIAATAGMFAAEHIFNILMGGPDGFFFENFKPNIMIQAVAIFVFAKYAFKPKEKLSLLDKIIMFNGRHSFGVYLSHILFMDIILYRFDVFDYFGGPIAVVAVSVVVYLMSLALSWALSKIPFVNKYIV